ncbi:hypothetical protein ACFYTF_27455 [Nocardia thailandica]|uniref:Uncharacterized protein n=1 Tax=Nocardia thailandica TaxID=257275 RepID=A0ABW6PVW9_9NOCA
MTTHNSSDAPQPGPSRNRVIAIAAVLAAILALVVALGLMMRAGQGDDQPTRVDQVTNGLADGGDQPVGVPFAPPWPSRREGGNCSAGGIVAHWVVGADGGWTCTPTPAEAVAPPPPPAPEPAPAPAPPPAPAPVEQAPPPAPVEAPPPVYEPPAPVEQAPAPEPAPAPAPPPPPPPVIQLPFPLPPILLPPAAATRG